MYENYLKQKQIEWKETIKEKKTKEKKVIFSPGWLYQPGLKGPPGRARGRAPPVPGWYN